jgi:hypothetical protein
MPTLVRYLAQKQAEVAWQSLDPATGLAYR